MPKAAKTSKTAKYIHIDLDLVAATVVYHFQGRRGDDVFNVELCHVQFGFLTYLAVEQALHEDSLVVEFDTPHTFFRVPPLTLQPLVENAVKHGIDPGGKPLHIFVKTAQTASGSEIVVENDGLDFTPANDNEPHIGLENIRQRISLMCGGTLAITPRTGGGTDVTIYIPKKLNRSPILNIIIKIGDRFFSFFLIYRAFSVFAFCRSKMKLFKSVP